MIPDFELPRDQRWLRRLAAWALGYFWLPCPCCGVPFAGFETGDRHLDVDGQSYCACRWCDDCPGAAREQADLAERAGEVLFDNHQRRDVRYRFCDEDHQARFHRQEVAWGPGTSQ